MKSEQAVFLILGLLFQLNLLGQSVGDKEADMLKELGRPNSTMEAGSTKIYLYDAVKVKVVRGVVSSVKVLKSKSQPKEQSANSTERAVEKNLAKAGSNRTYNDVRVLSHLLGKPETTLTAELGSPKSKRNYGKGINTVYIYEELSISVLNGFVHTIRLYNLNKKLNMPAAQKEISTQLKLQPHQKEASYRNMVGFWARKDELGDGSEAFMFVEYTASGKYRTGSYDPEIIKKPIYFEKYRNYRLNRGFLSRQGMSQLGETRVYIEGDSLVKIWFNNEIGPTRYQWVKVDLE